MRLAIINDYQKLASESADWKSLPRDIEIDITHERTPGGAEGAARLQYQDAPRTDALAFVLAQPAALPLHAQAAQCAQLQHRSRTRGDRLSLACDPRAKACHGQLAPAPLLELGRNRQRRGPPRMRGRGPQKCNLR